MISGHLHKPVIILNLQEREPALEERLNCSSLHSHSQSQDFDPRTFGTAEPCAPSTAWLGWCVTLEEDTAIKNTFMGTLWTQSWWGGGLERQNMLMRRPERSAQSPCGDALVATLDCSGPLHSQEAPLLPAGWTRTLARPRPVRPRECRLPSRRPRLLSTRPTGYFEDRRR